MNNESKFEATESIEEVTQNCELTENPRKGTFKKVGIGLCLTTAAAGVATFVVIKNKDRIFNLLAKVLEKNGYFVSKSKVSSEDAEVLMNEWEKQFSIEDENYVNIFDKKEN